MTTKTDWDLTVLFADENDPAITREKKEIERANSQFADKWRTRTDYLEDPKALRVALDELERIERRLGVSGAQGYYFSLRSELDQTNTELRAQLTQVSQFAEKVANNRRFFILNLAKISPETQQRFLAAAELGLYRHFLQLEFSFAQYLLSEKEENLLTLLSQPSQGNWVRMLESFLVEEEALVVDENGKQVTVPFAALQSLISDKNKQVRDSAAQAFHAIVAKHTPVAEHEINSIILEKKIEDELRGFTRPDQGRHMADDIESEVVDAMTTAVESRFGIAQRYYQLKARLMGMEKLEYHERGVEYGEISTEYSYEKALELTRSAFAKLDPAFVEVLERLNSQGQIDVFPKKGKSSGAFCACDSLELPTYVMLNHTNKLRDVLTLAHELGHAINDELMKTKQNALNFGTPLSTAEVASTFMEDFVLEALEKEADEDERLALMMMKLNDDISTIFRQVAAYRFEQQLHQKVREKGYLSKEQIGQIFQQQMAAYMGPAVEQSEGSQNWWVYWSHFRRFFYVYSYASGLLISKSLQHSVRQDSKFIEKVKGFLEAGHSDSPKSIFAKLGVDITDKKFWDQGLDEVEQLLKDTEQLAIKLGKLKT